MTHSHMTNRHSSISSNSGKWLNSYVNLFPLITYYFTRWVTGPLLLSSNFTLMTPFLLLLHHFFPWLRYCAYWGCTSWLIFWLTLFFAGRIFRQQGHNRIVCLVVESALHVYKGQFSPWFGQFAIQTLLNFTIQISQEFTTGILIQWKFIISASGTVLSKHSTSRLGVSKKLLNWASILHHHCVYH